MKKRHPVYTLLLAGAISVGLGQRLATASQQATETASVQTAKEQLQVHQGQSNSVQTTSGSAASSEPGGNQSSLSSTSASGLFGGDACRPEKIEVTPCK